MSRFIYTEEDMKGIHIIDSMKNIVEQNSNHDFTAHDLVKILTDISSREVNLEALPQAFDEVAISLLRQAKIVTPKEEYYLREIEIYLNDGREHNDVYTHCNKRQLEFGEWYFHRYTTLEPFLKNNRNGVDITFGNEVEKIYGGILIRKIQNIQSGKMIVGINKVARELLDSIDNNRESADNLAVGKGHFAFNRDALLHLEVENNSFDKAIYKTQRNGLTFKNQEKANQFYKMPYCYYNHDLNVSEIIQVRPAV